MYQCGYVYVFEEYDMDNVCDCVLYIDEEEVEGQGLSERERGEAMVLSEKSCTQGTWKGYNSKMKLYDEYLEVKDGVKKWGWGLERLTTQDDKVMRMVHFSTWLYNVKELRGKALKQVIAAVSTCFQVKGMDSEWSKDERMMRVRRACVITVEEKRNQNKREKAKGDNKTKPKLPLTGDMVRKTRELYWERLEGWTTREMDKRAIWLGLGLAFGSGLRPGMFTLAEGLDEDHCIRFRSMQITLVNGSTITGGTTLVNWLKEDKKNIKRVRSIDCVFDTHKTWKTNESQAAKIKTIGRRSEEEILLLENMLEWWMNANTRKNDEVFTRYSSTGTRRVLNRKDVATGIKLVANEMGLPQDRFSCKSLRSGYATHCGAKGVTSEEYSERGTWVKDSKVPNKHYQNEIGGIGAMGRGLNGVTLKELWSLSKV